MHGQETAEEEAPSGSHSKLVISTNVINLQSKR